MKVLLRLSMLSVALSVAASVVSLGNATDLNPPRVFKERPAHADVPNAETAASVPSDELAKRMMKLFPPIELAPRDESPVFDAAYQREKADYERCIAKLSRERIEFLKREREPGSPGEDGGGLLKLLKRQEPELTELKAKRKRLRDMRTRPVPDARPPSEGIPSGE